MIDFGSRLDRTIRRWPTEHARNWVRAFLEEATQSPEVLAVVALGSSVRPNVPSEDVDLLVLCSEGSDLTWRAPIEVDLRSSDLSKLERDLASGGDLATWAIRYGVPLYDERSIWAQLASKWRDQLRLPDPDVAESRAAKAYSQFQALSEAGDDAAANELLVSHLTHRARAVLSRAGIFPASRPELATQLRSIQDAELGDALEAALAVRRQMASETTVV